MNKRSLILIAIALILIILVASFIIFELNLSSSSVSSGSSSDSDSSSAPWKRPIDNFATSLAVDDCNVFTTDSIGNVHCFDSQNGKSIWDASVQGGTRYSNLPILSGKVYVSFTDRRVSCLDEDNGTLLWTFQNEQSPYQLNDAAPGLIAKDDQVFVKSDTISALNATTGELLWQAVPGRSDLGHITGVNETWSVMGHPLNGDPFDGNSVYALGIDLENAHYFKLNAATGSVLWWSSIIWNGAITRNAGFLAWIPSVLAITQRQVIIENHLNAKGQPGAHLLFGLDSTSGIRLWSFDVGADIYNPIVNNNMLLFAARRLLLCLKLN
jgi:outer membrane protein assembly factor BamB